MLKTDLLDRFLTDSVKHKKPMECSEALFDTIDTIFLQVNPDGTLRYCNRFVVRQRVTQWKKPKDGCSGKFFPLRKKGDSSRTFLRKHWNLPTVLFMKTIGAAVMGSPG